VTLINTKGLSFFGPGSEWFWAALQFTALAITFIAIYRQLRLGRSARAFEQVDELSRQFDDERMYRHRLAILMAVRDNLEIPVGAGGTVGNYFEGLGSLSRSGHLDIKLIWRVFGLTTLRWWTVLEPFVQRSRANSGDAVFEDFEWLIRVLTKVDRREGRTYEAAFAANWLAAGAIEGLQDRIRVEESLRTVTIAPSHVVDSAQAAAPAPSAGKRRGTGPTQEGLETGSKTDPES
jgi:hypothetical protein